ncbi:hypothetical protein B0H10DRAFT_2053564 [Mycena sp. CBHHK59/15]|nr:hypothetical protein B0H10DRAFT_2053564 [Mycena sp. CBHHK59/15]
MLHPHYALTAAATCPAPALPGEWLISDYQGQVFNLVYTNPANLRVTPGWLFIPTSDTNMFEIVNVGTASFLSYSTLIIGSEAIRSQVVGNQVATQWSFNTSGGQIIEHSSGLAATSWPVGSSSSNVNPMPRHVYKHMSGTVGSMPFRRHYRTFVYRNAHSSHQLPFSACSAIRSPEPMNVDINFHSRWLTFKKLNERFDDIIETVKYFGARRKGGGTREGQVKSGGPKSGLRRREF